MFFAPGADGHPASSVQEMFGDGPADTAGGSGDKRRSLDRTSCFISGLTSLSSNITFIYDWGDWENAGHLLIG